MGSDLGLDLAFDSGAHRGVGIFVDLLAAGFGGPRGFTIDITTGQLARQPITADLALGQENRNRGS